MYKLIEMKKTTILIIFIICIFLNLNAQKTKTQTSKPKTDIYESLLIKKKPIPLKVKDYIKVSYEKPIDTNHLVWYETFKEEKFLEQIAKTLNSTFKITKPFKITCKECGVVNAFYNSNTKELEICYEIFEDIRKKYEKYTSNPDSLGTRIGYTFSFILYHEIGHALIDFFDIPLTGKEEDAADYFAFYILGSNDVDEGVSACLEGANFFKEMHNDMLSDTAYQRINKEGKALDVLPFWDEHSFNLQRYYSINSLLFGSNPDKYQDLYYDGKIGYRRPGNAIQEYQKIKRGWTKVLQNYIKWHD